jgi:predicted DNA-binding protein YlxM (UPF0122 family)
MAVETEVYGDSRGVKANLWNSLEVLSTQAALLMEWKQELGDDFAAARVFLLPTQQQTGSYPCTQPIPCGCRHRVIFDSPEDISAVCDCDEGGCDPVFLRPSDLVVYSLNGEMLAAALRQAFRFDEMPGGGFGEVRSRLVGAWGLRRSHVFFNVPISENGLLIEIDRLCAMVPEPFLLLTPTSRFCTPMAQRALTRQGCAQMALAGVVTLTAPGTLELLPAAKNTVDVLFSDFGKRHGKPLELAIARVEAKLDALAKSRSQMVMDSEDPPEDVARNALALAKELDTTRRMKNPTLLTVFRLYCIDEMSASQIARECACSKTAILKRLKILAQRIGMPPQRLRRYSAQFERMETEMEDSRAKRIHRPGLTDDGGASHDDAD